MFKNQSGSQTIALSLLLLIGVSLILSFFWVHKTHVKEVQKSHENFAKQWRKYD